MLSLEQAQRPLGLCVANVPTGALRCRAAAVDGTTTARAPPPPLANPLPLHPRGFTSTGKYAFNQMPTLCGRT